MSKQHEIRHINDLLALSAEELVRLLPDLVMWHMLTNEAMKAGAEPIGMVWVDDGRPGEMHSARLHIKGTDRIEVVKGEAWSEDA